MESVGDIVKSIKANFFNNRKITNQRLLEWLLNKAISEHGFQSLLDSFNYCFDEIEKACETIIFNDEKHKINTILLIMTKNIGNAKQYQKDMEKSEEIVKRLDNSFLKADKAEYKTKSEKKMKHEDLWE